MKVLEKLRNQIGVLLSGEKNLKPSKSFNGERERERDSFETKFIFVWNFGIGQCECEVVLGRMIHAGNCNRRFFIMRWLRLMGVRDCVVGYSRVRIREYKFVDF